VEFPPTAHRWTKQNCASQSQLFPWAPLTASSGTEHSAPSDNLAGTDWLDVFAFRLTQCLTQVLERLLRAQRRTPIARAQCG
jgi:hypothetical protein